MTSAEIYNVDCIAGMHEHLFDDSVDLTVTSIPCPQCSTAFARRRANQKFCSQKCKYTFTNRTRILKPNVTSACVVCGEPFSRYVEPSKIAAGLATAEYCSLRCKGKALSGERHPMWLGGRIVEADGYVMLFRPQHQHANNKGYVFEHRIVMERQLGRLLVAAEVVHHIDANRANNHPLNLQLYENNAAHKRDDIVSRERDVAGRLTQKASD